MKIYLVGGAVRDKLLGLESSDKDYVVVGSSIQEMKDLGYIQVGADFPVFLHPKTREEYALARREVKTAPGYKGFKFEWEDVSLEEDLQRRDLTINAMAMELDSQKIIDPYNGQEDLINKKLKHVSSHFVEDPLRVLRVARFYAQFDEFSIDEDLKNLCRRIAKSGELDELTEERVWLETQKALSKKHSSKYFECLNEVGAMTKIFPEFNLDSVENNFWEQAIKNLDQASHITEDINVRFCSFLYPIMTDYLQGQSLCTRLKLSNESKKLINTILKFRNNINDIFNTNSEDTYHILKNIGALKENDMLDKVLLVCKINALALGEPNFSQADYIYKLINAFKTIDFKNELNKATEKQERAKELYIEKINELK